MLFEEDERSMDRMRHRQDRPLKDEIKHKIYGRTNAGYEKSLPRPEDAYFWRGLRPERSLVKAVDPYLSRRMFVTTKTANRTLLQPISGMDVPCDDLSRKPMRSVSAWRKGRSVRFLCNRNNTCKAPNWVKLTG